MKNPWHPMGSISSRISKFSLHLLAVHTVRIPMRVILPDYSYIFHANMGA